MKQCLGIINVNYLRKNFLIVIITEEGLQQKQQMVEPSITGKNNKYNDLTIDELSKELQEKKEALFNMRFQKSLQQLDHPIMIRDIKKDIARIKTKINLINSK